jgi:hypothetical protein
MAVRRRSSRLVWVVGTLIAVVVAAFVAGLGPEAELVCGTGHVLDRVAQALMKPLGAGQIDGRSATYCIVPSTRAWLMSSLSLMVVVAVTSIFVRRRGAHTEP